MDKYDVKHLMTSLEKGANQLTEDDEKKLRELLLQCHGELKRYLSNILVEEYLENRY